MANKNPAFANLDLETKVLGSKINPELFGVSSFNKMLASLPTINDRRRQIDVLLEEGNLECAEIAEYQLLRHLESDRFFVKQSIDVLLDGNDMEGALIVEKEYAQILKKQREEQSAYEYNKNDLSDLSGDEKLLDFFKECYKKSKNL